MEDMDLPHPRSLSHSKHGIKGSNMSQEYAATTPNEFIQGQKLLYYSIPVLCHRFPYTIYIIMK